MKMQTILSALLAWCSTVTMASAEDQAAPWSQGDAYNDPQEMAEARKAVLKEHGAGTTYYVLADRFEVQTGEGDPTLMLEGAAWWGGDRNKLWLKTETEYSFEENEFEEAEVQALWSRAVSRYFDFQAGVRHDFSPDPSRTYAVLGVQGLAPYWFEVDAALFVSDKGDVSARLEAEYELMLTQRLILQPSAEADISFQTVDALNIGEGLSTIELGARLRYEIKREFAPYIGVHWTRDLGDTADFSRSNGEDPSVVSLVAGVRFWF
ncbi:copper resistance protein B [Hyphococcus sp.]|uniref:copper resistance protein B n=1 Tax=Hyphococcus sp. TaxID=2038636 RepID=UPI0035C68DD5